MSASGLTAGQRGRNPPCAHWEACVGFLPVNFTFAEGDTLLSRLAPCARAFVSVGTESSQSGSLNSTHGQTHVVLGTKRRLPEGISDTTRLSDRGAIPSRALPEPSSSYRFVETSGQFEGGSGKYIQCVTW